ncbi:MAG: phage portal protein [endosymbiont of Escarpia spicata]|uniref:Phage portal protein n=1 Tax=endosymbiont of Escarpia spicata TaxID=2200908 RepID=A0A370DPW3_9GAMM|nr:MAG: phage portal protein [endosymbiont of Escarpia spicata]
MVDRAISYLSPGWAVRRAHARRVLSYYEAAKPSTLQKQRKETGSADVAVRRAGAAMRQQARHLEQNHDIARGVLSTLVNNVVGPAGIGVEPQPRTKDGEIHDVFARQIEQLYKEWCKRPEVTWIHNWPAAQRLTARTWFRDGEALGKKLVGPIPSLDHGTNVPFSLELLEPDYLPLDYDDEGRRIIQGIEHNGWRRPTVYHIYKAHPGNGHLIRTYAGNTTRVPAAKMLHLALRDRLGQARGVTVFASIMSRLDDLKDYEESERIAAKVAASMAGYIKKGVPDQYEQDVDEDGNSAARDLRFRPGMIFDDLAPGEEIGTIDTSRPNSGLEGHRNGQLRALASGPGVTYSSVSKDYNGSYSSQRQELVEGWIAYGVLSDEFVGKFVQPVYEDFIQAALLAGQLVIPSDVDPKTVDDALYITPQMPWIDPDKEAKGWERLERNGHASGPEIVRRRGRSPRDVFEQEKVWRRKWREAGEMITADPATEQTTEIPDDEEKEDENRRQA